MVKVKDILREIEHYAPLPLQEGFDNAGVQVGDVNQHATGVLLCLDVTEEVLDEAIEMGYNLIISHHPLAFKSFKSLTGSNYIERCMMKACKYDLVVYAAHTNLDNAVGGVNYRLAELIGLQNVRILSPQKGALLKLVTFVPEAYAEIMRNTLFNAGAGSIYRLTAEAAAVLQNENTEWTVLCVDYKNGSYQNRLCLDAKENSRLNVLIVFRSGEDAQGTSSFQVKVHAEKNAKVQLQEVQLLGAGYTCLSDIGASCGENATFELLKLELGAGKVYAGCLTELEGKKSAFDAKIGYYTSVNQKLDMNYTVRHRGKKTESMMEVSGVLQDGSSKLFRGTIDFVPGCAGAKGTEREDVLLLGDDIVNQTIPLILCAEEDVEGNHGASMGDLDDATLFYLCSRGLSREEAERMVARARIDALNELVADEAVQKQVQEFMNQKR
mgnify:CR=1 FL=1